MARPSTRPGGARRRTRANGEGSIRHDKRRDRWVATITIGWESVGADDGVVTARQVRRSVTGKTKAEVLRRMREAQGLVDEGIKVPPRTRTVAAMLDQWLREILPGTVSPATEGQYADVVRLYIKPRIGRLRVKELAPSDVTRMLRDMERPTDTRPTGYSANSRRLARTILRRALRWAQVEGLVSRNVAALASGVHVARPEGRTMTPQQARVFLDHIRGDRYEAMYVVALTLGLRVSELLALGWDDVNLTPPDGSTPTVTIRRGLKRIKGRGLLIDGVKTRTSRRTVHLPAVAAEQLAAHRTRQLEERLAFPSEWPDTPLGVDLVFRSAAGSALDPSNVWHYLSKATRHAGAEYLDEERTQIKPGTGLGHWHPHELRHSAASLMLAQGVPLKVVSEVLGHSGINITADIYAHVMAPLKDDAAAAMDRALGR